MIYEIISLHDLWLAVKSLSHPLVDINSVFSIIVADIKSVCTEAMRLDEFGGKHGPEASALREAQGLQLCTRVLRPTYVWGGEGARPPEAQPECTESPTATSDREATSEA